MKVMITGTSRGIGLELARQARGAGHEVLAVVRQPEKTPELKEWKIETVRADVGDASAMAAIAEAAAKLGAIDILINNAGIYRKDETADDFLETFRINSVAPFFVTQAVKASLKKSSAPKVIHISSLMGSVADNASGGAYSYRASKAALNAINKSLAVDEPWLTTIVMHPGWVQTSMGGANAPTPATESAAGIWKVIDGLRKEKSGHFFDFRGRELPW